MGPKVTAKIYIFQQVVCLMFYLTTSKPNACLLLLHTLNLGIYVEIVPTLSPTIYLFKEIYTICYDCVILILMSIGLSINYQWWLRPSYKVAIDKRDHGTLLKSCLNGYKRGTNGKIKKTEKGHVVVELEITARFWSDINKGLVQQSRTPQTSRTNQRTYFWAHNNDHSIGYVSLCLDTYICEYF